MYLDKSDDKREDSIMQLLECNQIWIYSTRLKHAKRSFK